MSKPKIEVSQTIVEKLKKSIEVGLLKYEKLPKVYTNSLGMDFVLIPPGEYIKISEKETDSQNIVYIKDPFYLGQYPVTRGDLVGSSKSLSPKSEFGTLDRYPIENFNPDEVFNFIFGLINLEKKEYGLPNIVEWEYAASAGEEYFFTKGRGSSEVGEYAWTVENSEGFTHPVGLKRPNSWGLYDILGNVSELCLDCVSAKEFQLKYRGGSYLIKEANTLKIQNSSIKEGLGFRLVLRDVEFSEEEIQLSEKRRKERNEKIQFLLDWEANERERAILYENLPGEYTNTLGMEFVLIPSGKFLMGAVSQDKEANQLEKPQHIGILTKPFYMGKYPVTQEEWLLLMGNNPSSSKYVELLDPVDDITKKMALEFIDKLNQREGKTYRLPREEEWEYAARGKSTINPSEHFLYFYGDDGTILGEYAWYQKNADSRLHQVGEKKPNGFGLYDMMGSVREWCEKNIIKSCTYYAKEEENRISRKKIDYSDSTGEGFRLILADTELSREEIEKSKERQFKKKEQRRLEEERVQKEEERKRQEELENDRNWERLKEERIKLFEKLPKEYTNSLGMDFVLIPSGEFLMGAVSQDKAEDDEKPQHIVRITQPFYMGKYPVTQEEWENLMEKNPSRFKESGKRAPVESVSWEDCQGFIEKLNQKEGKVYRLPSEAEWEYSSRGRSTTDPAEHFIYFYGDDKSNFEDYAWSYQNSVGNTHQVGQKKPNGFGLYDIMGNVKEWCGDWYDKNYYQVSTVYNPKGPEKGEERVTRGISSVRLSIRHKQRPAYKSECGFRVILTNLEFTEQELELNSEIQTKKKEEKKLEEERKIREIARIKQIDQESDRIWKESKVERIAELKKLRKKYKNSLGMEFVLIPPGEFLMGAVPQDSDARKREKPQHKVRISKAFYLGKYPVTQEEWVNITGRNPSRYESMDGREPVESVSWEDCKKFIEILSQKEKRHYRLPTEAEWEYAARGKTTINPAKNFLYTYGDDITNLGDYAWYYDNSEQTTHPVGQKKPNGFGLYDIMGNVYEWCEDRQDYEYYSVSPVEDPKGIEKIEYAHRVLRGSNIDSKVKECRLSYRSDGEVNYRSSSNGLRLVLIP